MSTSLDSNIDFFIKNGMNVLFRGRHGTGKTARILEAFEKHKLKYQYYSASTLDAWVDFVGIPKETTDANGLTYLDLIRPKAFAEDQVEAIFLDEYNRAPKKVRNAVMELIQFKSINGKKFKNLKIVWAAINPEEDGDDKYDVEALDPAQIDRFHALIEVPYKPDLKYFKNKYGEMEAVAAVTWWSELDPKLQKSVSPRRLDYALDVHGKGGDIRFVLVNEGLNINKLITELQNGPISANLKKIYEAGDLAAAKSFLSAENNYSASTPYILKKKEYTNFFIPVLSDERISALMSKDKVVENLIFSQPTKFMGVIEDLAKNPTSPIARRAATIIQDMQRQKMLQQQQAALASGMKQVGFNGFFNAQATVNDYNNKFNAFLLTKPVLTTTQDRVALYNDVVRYMPKDINMAETLLNKVVFEGLLQIATTSHAAKINKDMPNLIPLINHILKNNSEFKTSVAQHKKDFLVDKYPHLWLK